MVEITFEDIVFINDPTKLHDVNPTIIFETKVFEALFINDPTKLHDVNPTAIFDNTHKDVVVIG